MKSRERFLNKKEQKELEGIDLICPLCQEALDENLDENGWVIDYFCCKCLRSFDLEALEKYKKKQESLRQKTLLDFF